MSIRTPGPPLLLRVGVKQLGDGHPQHLGQPIQLNVGNRALPVLDPGDRAPAHIDGHGLQLVGQGLLAHATLDAQGPHLLAHQIFGGPVNDPGYANTPPFVLT